MFPLPFTLGWIDIPSFTALMALALGVGLLLVWWRARCMGPPTSAVLDVAFAAILFGVIAARALYITFNWDYFQMHRDQIAQIWQGGLSWHGGLIGGAMGVWLACAWRKLSAQQAFDVFAPGLMAGAALGWLGCYLTGVAYGREVFPGDRWWLLAADLADIYGQWNPRFATQLLGAAWAAICFGISNVKSRVSNDQPRRLTFLAVVALYSAGMFVLGFTRGDAVPTLGGWRLDQVLDAAIVIAGVTFILLKRHAERASAKATPITFDI